MVSKNTLAIVIILAIVISVIGVYVILESATEEGQGTVAGVAKVKVIEEPKPPSSSGYATVNVIEKPQGG